MSHTGKLLYWLSAGGIMGFGLIAFGLGLLPTLLGGILAIYGVRLFGPRGFWMTLVGMGLVPALVLSLGAFAQRSQAVDDPNLLAGIAIFGIIAGVGAVWGVIETRRGRTA